MRNRNKEKEILKKMNPDWIKSFLKEYQQLCNKYRLRIKISDGDWSNLEIGVNTLDDYFENILCETLE